MFLLLAGAAAVLVSLAYAVEHPRGDGSANGRAASDARHRGDGRSRVGSEPGRPPGLRA